MQKSGSKLEVARNWADNALSRLAALSLNDRQLWCATAERGERHFNYQRMEFVCREFPEYRQKFESLGLRVGNAHGIN